MAELRFDNRVAIVTGAGNGLGRSHALLLASRGAKVVVNDLGGSTHGEGKSSAAADKVVQEIKDAGGQAVANYDSVEDGKKIVQCAMDTFGGVDIVINNAGILRDVSFQKMTEQDWELINRVHLLGAFRVTHAAWEHMRNKGYGRIIFTASAAGIYGNFGQANYSAVKLGLVGLAQTLALEGRKKGVNANAIAPIAGSRMTETVLPPELIAALKPEFVTPLVAYLCHDSCEETGGTFEVGGGFMGKLRWERAEGALFRLARPITPEGVKSSWNEITSFEKTTHPTDITSSMQPILGNLGTVKSKGGNEFIDLDLALGYEPPKVTSSYDERDVALYALGVGAAHDPLDGQELQTVYELHGDGMRVLPTFGVIPAFRVMMEMARDGKQFPGLNYGFDRVLHGEQYTEVKRPLPPKAKLTHKAKVKDIFDKGKNALVVTATTSYDEEGNELIYNELTTFVRGAGGWGGDRGPSAEVNVPPNRAPDATIKEQIATNQALLYRLSGDWNPLHADPSFAQNFGFKKPILHGLCTFGIAARHVIKAFAKNDPRLFKSIKARFADSVYPGDTIVTEMWKEGDTKIVLRCRVEGRDKDAISNAAVELYQEIPKKPEKKKEEAAARGAPAGGFGPVHVFAGMRDHVEKHPELVQKVATVYQWKLTSPESYWILDLKNGKGSVAEGKVEKPDTTLELTESDFLDMSSGKADPQKLYFGGKLKIAGNVMASQKLEFLKQIDKEAAKAAAMKVGASTASASPARAAETPKVSKTPALLAALSERLAKNAALAAEIGGTLQFKVGATAFHVSKAGVAEGMSDKREVTLTFSDEDAFATLAEDVSTAQDLYQRGQFRVDGDVRLVHKLGFLNKLV